MKVTVNESDEVVGVVYEKRCYKCKRTLPLREFGISRDKKDGHKALCKDCVAIYQKSHRTLGKKGVQPVPESKSAPVPEPVSNGSVLYNQNLEQTSIEWIKKVSVENITNEKQRRETLLSMVALMLELSYTDCAAVIAMVNAYRGVQP